MDNPTNTPRINENVERIQDHEIDLNNLLAMQHFPDCGGLTLFAGTVRNHHDGKDVESLKYTAYKPLAEKMIRQIEQEIEKEYGVSYVRVVHRIGHLAIGDVAIYAVARADHRREAFAACEEAVERVKHEVPVWKEEFYSDGSSVFVDGCCIRRDFQNDSSRLIFQTQEFQNQKNPQGHFHEIFQLDPLPSTPTPKVTQEPKVTKE
ncbi:MAG: molybdenum cofactor biosynthesis protein MoaE [Moraxellaceae bacterium]|nr:MAG: molybdenum cofactor biosynthesis protein MoaE [Moraxellaceae bacterium]